MPLSNTTDNTPSSNLRLCLLPLDVLTRINICSKPTRLHYMGVSFGLTQQLFNFWQRAGYEPLYVRQNASETTGEGHGGLIG